MSWVRNKLFKVLSRLLLVLILLFFIFIFVLSLKPVKNIILQRFSEYVSGSQNAELVIENYSYIFPVGIKLKGIYFSDSISNVSIEKLKFKPLFFSRKKTSIKAKVFIANGEIHVNTASFRKDSFSTKSYVGNNKTQKKNWIIRSDVILDQIDFSYIDKDSKMSIDVQVKDLSVEDAKIETIKHIVNWDDIFVRGCLVKLELNRNENKNRNKSESDWKIEGKTISLKECHFKMNQEQKSYSLSSFTDMLNVRNPKVYLSERQVEVDKLEIILAEVSEKMAVDTTKQKQVVSRDQIPWTVNLSGGKLEHIKFSHNIDGDKSADSVFSFQSFVVENLDTRIKDAYYSGNIFGGSFRKLNLNLNEKLILENTIINCKAENNKTHLFTKMNTSEGKILVLFDSDVHWQKMINFYDFPAFILSFQLDHISLGSYQHFIPALHSLNEWMTSPIDLKIDAKSDGGKVNIENLIFNLDPGINMKASGYIAETSDSGLFEYFSDFSANVDLQTINDSLTILNTLPFLNSMNNISTKGQINGDFQSLQLSQNLLSEHLNLPFSANYNWEDSRFSVEIKNAYFAIDSVFSFPSRVKSFDLFAEGQLGKTISAKYALHVNAYTLLEKNLGQLEISGSLQDKILNGSLVSGDSLIMAQIRHTVTFSEHSNVAVSGNFQLDNSSLIDKLPEGIYSAEFDASYDQFDTSSFKADLQVNNFVADTRESNYKLDSNSIHVEALKEGFHASMINDFASVDVHSGISLSSFADSVKMAIIRIKQEGISNTFNLISSIPQGRINVEIIHHPLIEDQLLNNIFNFDRFSVDLTAESRNRDRVFIEVVKPSYKDITANSITLDMGMSQESISMNASVLGLNAEKLAAKSVYLKSVTENNLTHVVLSSFNEKNNTQLYSKLNVLKDSKLFTINFPSDSIVLFGSTWNLNRENIVSFSGSEIDSCNFELKSGDKTFRLGINDMCPLTIETVNLDLGHLSDFFFRDNDLQGALDCEFCFLNKSLNSVRSELILHNVVLNGRELGKYNISSYYDVSDSSVMTFGGELVYNGKQIMQLDASTPGNEFRNSTFEARLSDLELEPYSPFFSKYLNSISGSISGFMNMSIKNSKDGVQGELSYKDLNVNPVLLNTELKFTDNKIKIEDRIINLNKIIARDEKGKKITLNGNVKFPFAENPIINLQARADSLVILNIPKRKNNSFFGKAIATNSIKISGLIHAPDINYSLNLIRGTDITYRIIENFSTNEGEGVVVFENADTLPDDKDVTNSTLLTQKKKTQIDAKIIIDPETIFRIIYDQSMKFTIRLSGKGNIAFLKKSNGEETMKGRYTVRDGEAVMNLQGLAPKDFMIVPNSFVQWDGSSSNPTMDIMAYHKVKGSYQNPSNTAEQTMIVDYKVFFSIRNRLQNPEIVFNVSTEDEYMTSVLNSMPEEERIKQAINLLLLGQIVTENTKTSGSKIISDHLNQFWAQQLNNAAEDNLGGVSLNVDIQSFTDYSAGNQYDRTNLSYELSKKVWNDKATVKVGGYVSTYSNSPDQAPSKMIGNVSLEYEIGKNDNIYGKVFSDHKYEGVLEGEIQRTGAGIMYKKNYKTFRDIWRRKKTENTKKKEIEEKN